jgi:hypothetical protein
LLDLTPQNNLSCLQKITFLLVSVIRLRESLMSRCAFPTNIDTR